MHSNILAALAAIAVASIVTACGNSDGPAGGAVVPVATTTITGSAVKGPVSGATVTIKNAATGATLGTTTTGAGGAYSLAVAFTGDVIVEVSGGTYTDEATGVATALAAPLKVVLNANGGTVTGVVTPLTTMAYTYAFGNNAAVTAAAFNTMAGNVATQFKLNEVNLATTLPTVTGAMNDYGRVLAGLSKYMQANAVTLPTLVNTAFSTAQWADFSTRFNTAYAAANPGANLSFNFNGNVLNLGGTGAGGGTGSCGVNVQGSITANGISVPLNLDYCFTGIAAGSCAAGNGALSQALAGQNGLVGAANLVYAFTAACVANPIITINLN